MSRARGDGRVGNFSIDVECVATGKERDNARGARCRGCALVDQFDRVPSLNVYVKPPDAATVALLPHPAPRVTAELIEANGVSLAEAVGQLCTALPKHAGELVDVEHRHVWELGLARRRRSKLVGPRERSCPDALNVFGYNSWREVFGTTRTRRFSARDGARSDNAAMPLPEAIRSSRWRLDAARALPVRRRRATLEEACSGS